MTGTMTKFSFTFKISFGGTIVHGPEIKYEGGRTAECRVSPESWTYSELLQNIRDFGLKGTFSISYMQSNPRMNSTLVPLTNDGELRNAFAIGGSKNENDLFVHGGHESGDEEEDDCQNGVTPLELPFEGPSKRSKRKRLPKNVPSSMSQDQNAGQGKRKKPSGPFIYFSAALRKNLRESEHNIDDQNRTALPSIVKLLQKLTQEQREAIKSMELGGLLELRCTRLHHDLLQWLVDKFDPSRCLLCVHGRELVLTITEVQRLLGIHGCGSDIMLAGFSDQVFKKLCFDLKVEQGVITLKALGTYLTDCKDVTLEFKRKFVLYMLGSFLCPTSQSYVTENYLHFVRDVDTLNESNWAKLTLQCLANGIRESRRTGRRTPNGCLFHLELFYVDHVIPATCQVVRDPSTSTLAHWGSKEITNIVRLLKSGVDGFERDEVHVNFRMFGERNETSPTKKGVSPLGGMKKTEKDNDMEVVKGKLGELLEAVGKLQQVGRPSNEELQVQVKDGKRVEKVVENNSGKGGQHQHPLSTFRTPSKMELKMNEEIQVQVEDGKRVGKLVEINSGKGGQHQHPRCTFGTHSKMELKMNEEIQVQVEDGKRVGNLVEINSGKGGQHQHPRCTFGNPSKMELKMNEMKVQDNLGTLKACTTPKTKQTVQRTTLRDDVVSLSSETGSEFGRHVTTSVLPKTKKLNKIPLNHEKPPMMQKPDALPKVVLEGHKRRGGKQMRLHLMSKMGPLSLTRKRGSMPTLTTLELKKSACQDP
ncbi:hypothetical protein Vadar_032962 [Vaccinium darrowii]|uniref:Uncharacterized protein n=1 Tax=Vaccinium darrowii TaxID=229202 RepID=A0ACB7Z061_9ERIC|nr:hypothetical protein Vadar_032962 [Vaccinium darrowii]